MTSWPFPSIPFNSVISLPSRIGNGAQIIGNTMFSNRGRGVSLQAGNSVISGNTIVNTGSSTGITLGPDDWAAESDFANNVLVCSQPVWESGS